MRRRMNWYEEKKLREEAEELMKEIAARNPELMEKYKRCREIIDARLKGVYLKLAGGNDE